MPNAPEFLPEKEGVVAVLQDEAGRYLLIRRGLALKRAPGWWCFVGGEIEPGETAGDAVVREVREEVGLHVHALEKVHESLSPNNEFRLHWLRVELASTPRHLTLNDYEVAEARWLTAEEARLLQPLLPGLKLWLDALLS